MFVNESSFFGSGTLGGSGTLIFSAGRLLVANVCRIIFGSGNLANETAGGGVSGVEVSGVEVSRVGVSGVEVSGVGVSGVGVSGVGKLFSAWEMSFSIDGVFSRADVSFSVDGDLGGATASSSGPTCFSAMTMLVLVDVDSGFDSSWLSLTSIVSYDR